MYRKNFVVAVQDRNGRTLREASGNRVFLPFGSEYQLLFKNKSDRNAVIEVQIDGTNALGGQRLVIPARSVHVLERFMLDGNTNSGKRFLFTNPQTDGRVQDPHSPDNGIVKILVWFESQRTYSNVWTTTPIITYPMRPWYPNGTGSVPFQYINVPETWTVGKSVGSTTWNIGSNVASTTVSVSNTVPHNFHSSVQEAFAASSSPQKGATVEGSQSSQGFYSMAVGPLETHATIFVFEMFAPADIKAPVTVQSTRTVYCSNCGKQVAWQDSFCSNCGKQLHHRDDLA